MMFQYDSDLADQYYLEHYANNTMYICTPHIPMRPDMRSKYAQTFPDRYYMFRCDIYQLGYLKVYIKKDIGVTCSVPAIQTSLGYT